MGVDITAIIGHRLSMEEILQLPSIISTWENVNQLAYTFHAGNPAYPLPEKDTPSADWDVEIEAIDEATLLAVWDFWASPEDDPNVPTPLTIDIDTCFGWLKVNRQTICICPFEHKFANLYEAETANYLFQLMRMIAQHLGAKEIVYAPDSAFPESFLEEMSFMGRSIEEIMKLGNEKFGEAVLEEEVPLDKHYFVDIFGE